MPPYKRGSVSLSRGAGRKPCAYLYTRKRLSLSLDLKCLTEVAGTALARGAVLLVDVETLGDAAFSQGRLRELLAGV